MINNKKAGFSIDDLISDNNKLNTKQLCELKVSPNSSTSSSSSSKSSSSTLSPSSMSKINNDTKDYANLFQAKYSIPSWTQYPLEPFQLHQQQLQQHQHQHQQDSQIALFNYQLQREQFLRNRFDPRLGLHETNAAAAAAAFFLQNAFRKPKRIRTAFTPSQLLKLENAFESNHYVVGQERKELAKSLNLSETQVSNSYIVLFSSIYL
jgi:hypothetical protein